MAIFLSKISHCEVVVTFVLHYTPPRFIQRGESLNCLRYLHPSLLFTGPKELLRQDAVDDKKKSQKGSLLSCKDSHRRQHPSDFLTFADQLSSLFFEIKKFLQLLITFFCSWQIQCYTVWYFTKNMAIFASLFGAKLTNHF